MIRTLTVLSLAMVTLFTAPVQADEFLNGAGATFPAPLYSAWAYEYSRIAGVKLNYQSIGSGGGQRQIMERTIDFGATDDPLAPGKLAKDNLLQFPTVIGAITPVVNIPGIRPNELKLDGPLLAAIFLGDIRSWDDGRIKALNPGLSLPHSGIVVVHRSDGSGTTAIFTHYLAEVSADWKKKVGEGKAVSWPAGIGGKGNEGVANYIKQTAHAIGYVEFAYAKQNKLVPVQLKNAAGAFVEPTFASFENAAESADFDSRKGFSAWLTNAPGRTSWPLAGATFVLLARDRKDANRKTVQFIDWAYKNGDGTAKNLMYIPLPKGLKDKVRAFWKENGLQ